LYWFGVGITVLHTVLATTVHTHFGVFGIKGFLLFSA
jgi:hypothetical protein